LPVAASCRTAVERLGITLALDALANKIQELIAG